MQAIHVCSARFYRTFDMPQVEYEVLYDGQKFRCDADTLDRLYDGIDPGCLDLIVVDPVLEDGEVDDAG